MRHRGRATRRGGPDGGDPEGRREEPGILDTGLLCLLVFVFLLVSLWLGFSGVSEHGKTHVVRVVKHDSLRTTHIYAGEVICWQAFLDNDQERGELLSMGLMLLAEELLCGKVLSVA